MVCDSDFIGKGSDIIMIDKNTDCCNDCPYHYELTEEQKNGPYIGDCGCLALEERGICYKADIDDNIWYY